MVVTKLELITAEMLEKIKVEWHQQLDVISSSDGADLAWETYERAFLRVTDWLKGGMEREPHVFFYAALADECKEIDAIVTVSYVKWGSKWLKALYTTVAPRYESAQEDEVFRDLQAVSSLGSLGAKIVVGCLELAYLNHPCKTLKMRFQSPLDARTMAALITTHLADTLENANIKMRVYRGWVEFNLDGSD